VCLFQLYISNQNEDASESDFKKALDLLVYVTDDMDRSDLK